VQNFGAWAQTCKDVPFVLQAEGIEVPMPKTSTVHARIDPDLKNETEELFRQLGLSVTQAITLFYKQVQLRRGLPFDVVIPNEVTRKTFEDTDAGRNLTMCEDAKDMFDKLAI
jgi:DNA-damage-inducible protein J